MTRDEFAVVFAFIRGAFPAQVVTEDTASAYFLALEDFDARDVRDAVLRVCRTSRFWPSIAEIAQAVTESVMAIPDPEALFSEIIGAVRNVGYYGRPQLSPVAQAVANTMGWKTLCDSENPEADRAHIMKIAATYRKRALEAGNFASAGLSPGTPCPPVERTLNTPRLGDGLKEIFRDLEAGK